MLGLGIVDPLKQAESFSKLSGVASEYGPFFFALLFILFVPVIGQAWFSKMLQSKVRPGLERQKALEVYQFYWMSGVVTGLILVIVSVGWWIYVERNYVLPERPAALNELISQELSRRIFEGTIRGVSTDDMFIQDLGNPDYKLYPYVAETDRLRVVRFVVIFSKEPPKDLVVQFLYMSRATMDALANPGGGGQAYGFSEPLRIPLCIRKASREVSIVRDPKNGPRFNATC